MYSSLINSLHPLACELDLQIQHLAGIGLSNLSMEQLVTLEQINREIQTKISDEKVTNKTIQSNIKNQVHLNICILMILFVICCLLFLVFVICY
jgi:hypothetical protein